MNISVLLEAAEYLERREKEFYLTTEHGYASAPLSKKPSSLTGKKGNVISTTKKSIVNRNSHNELEKNRRAHLRGCLEKLKDIVPLGAEGKHTTLGLLTRAKKFIKKLEKSNEENVNELNQLTKKQTFLKWRCEQLSLGVKDNMTKRRSVSESSSSTFSSTNSQELLRTSSLSEFDEQEQDILCNNSDSDEFLLSTRIGRVRSITASSADSGIVIRKSSISEEEEN